MATIAVLSSHTPSLFWFRMDMMKEFMSRGWRVYAIANEPESEWVEKFKEKGIIYRQIVVQRNGMNPIGDLKTLNSIRRVLKEIKPDKVFCFQAKTVIYGAMASNLRGIKEVYPLIAGMGSIFLNDNLKTRLVRGIVSAEYKLALRKCPVVFFQNHDDEEIFRKNRIVTGQNVVLLHGSGVSTTRFEVKPLPDSITFLCISRLIRDKGVGEYLEASRKLKKKYPTVKCHLVGPYDTNPSAIREQDLKPYIEDGSIEYFGETDEVRPFYYQSSVFVLPSYREGTPKTNLEAMASGRPVITTDTPGCKETVIDKHNGFLVPVKSINALYEKMVWFVEHPDQIEPMGKKGRKMAEDIFDVKKVDGAICAAMKI